MIWRKYHTVTLSLNAPMLPGQSLIPQLTPQLQPRPLPHVRLLQLVRQSHREVKGPTTTTVASAASSHARKPTTPSSQKRDDMSGLQQTWLPVTLLTDSGAVQNVIRQTG